jgi:hypothetical protein
MRVLAAAVLIPFAYAQQPAVDFAHDVAPILLQRCVECHGEKVHKGHLRLDQKTGLFGEDHDKWPVLPGEPDKSDLLRRVQLPQGDDDVMPNKGELLTAAQIATLKAWVQAGADWPADGDAWFTKAIAARDVPKIDFGIAPPAADVQSKIDASLQQLVQKGVVAARVAADTPAVDVNASLLGAAFGDDDLAVLADLAPVLVWLNVARTGVTDRGLEKLAGMAQLRRLNVANTAVGDDGIGRLAGLPRLEVVNAYGSKLTDRGLSALGALPALRKVYAFSTAVTAEGAAAAQKQKPDLVVDRGEYAQQRLDAAAAEIAARAASKPVNDTCPVSGKAVDPSTAIEHEGLRIAFCCKDCQAAFQKEPAKFAAKVEEYRKAAAAKKAELEKKEKK